MKSFKQILSEAIDDKLITHTVNDGRHKVNFWKRGDKSGVDILTHNENGVNVSASSVISDAESHEAAKAKINDVHKTWLKHGNAKATAHLEKITNRRWSTK